MSGRDEIHARLARLARRIEGRSDYGMLLSHGEVMREASSVGEARVWRAAIRREARADCIPIRTGRGAGTVWARMVRPPLRDEDAEYRLDVVLRLAVASALDLRHEPELVVRDGAEVVCYCVRCRVYGYACATDAVAAGELFETPCPCPGPPEITFLGYFYGTDPDDRGVD